MAKSIVYNRKNKTYLKCDNLWKSPVVFVDKLEDATIYHHNLEEMEDLLSSAFYYWPWNNCIIKRLYVKKDKKEQK